MPVKLKSQAVMLETEPVSSRRPGGTLGIHLLPIHKWPTALGHLLAFIFQAKFQVPETCTHGTRHGSGRWEQSPCPVEQSLGPAWNLRSEYNGPAFGVF